jgi:hypothetical protein
VVSDTEVISGDRGDGLPVTATTFPARLLSIDPIVSIVSFNSALQKQLSLLLAFFPMRVTMD